MEGISGARVRITGAQIQTSIEGGQFTRAMREEYERWLEELERAWLKEMYSDPFSPLPYDPELNVPEGL